MLLIHGMKRGRYYMDEKQKEKYIRLKEKNRKNRLEDAWKNNLQFEEYISALSSVRFISNNENQYILDEIIKLYPISDAGHIIWDDFFGEKLVSSYEFLERFVNLSEDYYVIWDRADLPIIICRLKSIVDNFDDFKAISFSAFIVSLDFKTMIEVRGFGSLTLGRLK